MPEAIASEFVALHSMLCGDFLGLSRGVGATQRAENDNGHGPAEFAVQSGALREEC
jgi:predicted Zn-dependent protease with MMP-like domain